MQAFEVKGSLCRLQLIQNAAAKLITGTKKYEHITPLPASLDWLCVRFCIDFTILLLTFKAINGLSLKYISDLLTWYEPSWPLRPTDSALLAKSSSQFVTKCDPAFSIRAPTLWRSLPAALRHTTSLDTFKTLLKTVLFRSAFGISLINVLHIVLLLIWPFPLFFLILLLC